MNQSISESWSLFLVNGQWKFGPIENRRSGLSHTPWASTPHPLSKVLRRLQFHACEKWSLFLDRIALFYSLSASFLSRMLYVADGEILIFLSAWHVSLCRKCLARRAARRPKGRSTHTRTTTTPPFQPTVCLQCNGQEAMVVGEADRFFQVINGDFRIILVNWRSSTRLFYFYHFALYNVLLPSHELKTFGIL